MIFSRSSFALAALLFASPAVAAECDDLKARLERGFVLQVELHATDLTDAGRSWSRSGQSFLIPKVVSSDCNGGSLVATFDRPIELTFADSRLSAFVVPAAGSDLGGFGFRGRAFASEDLGYNRLVMSELRVHNAVLAHALARWGFETFEGVQSGPWTSVLALQEPVQIPYQTRVSQVIGVASKDDHLYQMSVKYLIDLPPVAP